MSQSSRAMLVRCIAETLNLPDDIFYDEIESDILHQAAELFLDFHRILDPQARQKCLDFVRASAAGRDQERSAVC